MKKFIRFDFFEGRYRSRGQPAVPGGREFYWQAGIEHDLWAVSFMSVLSFFLATGFSIGRVFAWRMQKALLLYFSNIFVHFRLRVVSQRMSDIRYPPFRTLTPENESPVWSFWSIHNVLQLMNRVRRCSSVFQFCIQFNYFVIRSPHASKSNEDPAQLELTSLPKPDHDDVHYKQRKAGGQILFIKALLHTGGSYFLKSVIFKLLFDVLQFVQPVLLKWVF